MRRQRPTIYMEVTDIRISVSGQSVFVTSKATGRNYRLPYDALDFVPKAVVLPEWLYKKLRKEQENKQL